jgi:hypothetical protein
VRDLPDRVLNSAAFPQALIDEFIERVVLPGVVRRIQDAAGSPETNGREDTGLLAAD